MIKTTTAARVRTRTAPPTLIAAPAILDPGANPLPSEAPTSPAPHCGNKRPLSIVDQSLTALRPASRQVRRRGKGQIEKLMANIAHFGCVLPVLVAGAGEVIDGHAVVEACRRLDLQSVPTIIIDDLSPEEVKALRISLNKLAESSTWDPVALAADLEELLRIPDLISLTGFTMPEIDLALASFAPDPNAPDPADHVPEMKGQAVSRLGDLWLFAGGHKLYCGNAREGTSYDALLAGEPVQMVFTDPPYGCAIEGHVSRSHREFVEGSGMSESETLAFFEAFLAAMVRHLGDGAIVDLCIDWRGMHPLVTALRAAGLNQKALCIWDKGAGGMGSLYRQQAEFVIVAKWGTASHINNIQLGRYGRNRTTVWSAPGLAQFGRGRDEALALHPTVKPVGLVADALLDTSTRNGVVLDPFAGSGTTLLAAHRTRRLGRAIELDPRYVDVAVQRMEMLTQAPAHHAATGRTFAALAAQRAAEAAEPAETAIG